MNIKLYPITQLHDQISQSNPNSLNIHHHNITKFRMFRRLFRIIITRRMNISDKRNDTSPSIRQISSPPSSKFTGHRPNAGTLLRPAH